MSLSFKIALAADLIALLVAGYFLMSDYIRQSSSNNGPLALTTLVFMGWIATSYHLYMGGFRTAGSIMAWVPAMPIIGYGLMILLFIIFKPDMR